MAGNYNVTPIVGGPGFAFELKNAGTVVNPGATESDASPQHAIGTVTLGEGNTTLIYAGPAAAQVVRGAVCTVNPTTFAITTAAGNHTALKTLEANQYGWCRQTAVFQP